MMKARFGEGLQLLRTRVERRIVNCVAARSCKGKISKIYALEMSDLAILRKEEWSRWFGDHVEGI
jgi:hypothetical protein